MTSSVDVFESATWVKSMYMTQAWFKSRKKGKIWKSKEFLHKSSSNTWFSYGIHSLFKQSDVRGSADVIYRMWRISLLRRSGI